MEVIILVAIILFGKIIDSASIKWLEKEEKQYRHSSDYLLKLEVFQLITVMGSYLIPFCFCFFVFFAAVRHDWNTSILLFLSGILVSVLYIAVMRWNVFLFREKLLVSLPSGRKKEIRYQDLNYSINKINGIFTVRYEKKVVAVISTDNKDYERFERLLRDKAAAR